MKSLLPLLLLVPVLALAAEPPAKEMVCRACHGAGVLPP